MDLAYDHIQEDAYPKDQPKPSETTPKPEQTESTLNKDFQEAYKAFSNSPWGVRLGGFLGNVVKQGGEVYTQAQKEVAELGEDAQKGFSELRETLISRTRALSVNTTNAPAQSSKDAEDGQKTPTKARAGGSADNASGESSENYLARLRSEAAKRIEELRRAEDAADEALLKFGVNVRDFLKEAISIAPPQGGSEQGSAVLFESKDAQGKRVIHTSRFDAQLHVIHTSTESFAKEPSGAEFEKWVKEFDIDKKTTDIEADLKKYPELRATMEKLVPTQIPYADFWKRYYFLRHGIETAEARRRDLLKAASAQDEVGWGDDDSDSDSDDEPTPAKPQPASAASSTTIHPPAKETLKPAEARKSNDEKSQADSEASYDVVGAASGKTSQAPSSPKDPKDPKKEESSSDEDSDEDDSSDEDWE